MPPCHTPLLQQAALSQSQLQPCSSFYSHAPSQSHSCHHHHQAAIASVPGSGEEFNFTSVEHKNTSAICSNVATGNSTPSPLVQAQTVNLPAHKALQEMQWISTTSSLREMQLINMASWLWDNCAAFACESGCLSYLYVSLNISNMQCIIFSHIDHFHPAESPAPSSSCCIYSNI